MLRHLRVENFAVIERVALRFGPALNIITGETGAGKSLLVEALMAVLGERISGDVVRTGARRAVIEAEFDIAGHTELIELLRTQGYESPIPEHLILRREITPSGSRAFVNDSPAPLTFVKQLGDLLVDFHGQHEHQSLLKASLHRKLLDSVGGLERIVSEYMAAWSKLRSTIECYISLRQREHELHTKRDYQQHLLTELQNIDPQPNEKALLEAELRRFEHSEQLFEGTATSYALLYGTEHSAHDTLVRVRNILEQLARIDDSFSSAVNEIRDLVIRTDELAKDIQRYNADLEFSPERLEQIRERLALLSRLERRYGSLEQAVTQRKQLEEELALADNFEAELERLRQQILQHRRELGILAQRLSAKRQQTARRIEHAIEDILAKLGMQDTTFRVVIKRHTLADPDITELAVEHEGSYYRAFEHGTDEVAFHISTNKGEPLAPLHRIISGGEASRVMLALKTILAKSDRLPLLIFDEIDTGISGRIAHRVGVALEELSAYHQIIAITHTPQIAARAQTHLVVEKHTDEQHTHIMVREVTGTERVEEIAKLIAGESITEGARRTARDLLRQSSTYAAAS